MDEQPLRTRMVLLGATTLLLALLVVAVAIAGSTGSHGAGKTTSVSQLDKQLKTLKKRLKRDELKLAAFQKEEGPQGPGGSPGSAGSDGAIGAQGTTGARGATGATGPSTGAASGDLAGNYPAPTIAPDAVTGAKVAPGSLTAADIDTSTLGFVSGSGVRRTSDAFTAANTFADVTFPGVGTLRVDCGTNAGSGAISWINGVGNTQYVTHESGTDGGAPTFGTDELNGLLSSSQVSFATSATNSLGHRAEFQVTTFNAAHVVTATASLITHPSGLTSSCFYGIDVLGPS